MSPPRGGSEIPPAVERRFLSIDDPRWVQCHAATVATARAGNEPVVAWFAGTHEGAADSRVWIWRDGRTTCLETGVDEPHWNPVLSPGPDGALWLFVKVGHQISRWRTLATRSLDGGRTWAPVRELVPGDSGGGRGPVRNQPLLTPAGLWLAPGSTESWAEPPVWDCFVDVSHDRGETWATSPVPFDHARAAGAGVIQPALWWGRTGPVAMMRSTAGRAYRSQSSDGGTTWSPAAPTDLPNGNSGLAVVALPSGRVACVHNPAATSWGARCPLVVSVSDDDGWTWRRLLTLDDGRTPVDPAVPPLREEEGTPGFAPADTGVRTSGRAEYSYPCAILESGTVLVTYTWQRRGIVLARLPLRLLD